MSPEERVEYHFKIGNYGVYFKGDLDLVADLKAGDEVVFEVIEVAPMEDNAIGITIQATGEVR
jgi:hypothetical protein